jgi:hypothetical protein
MWIKGHVKVRATLSDDSASAFDSDENRPVSEHARGCVSVLFCILTLHGYHFLLLLVCAMVLDIFVS